MNLHVMHDAKTVAHLTHCTPPACDALICRLGQPDHVAAAWLYGNPLQENWLACTEIPAPRLLCWSGSLAAETFAVHPPNWMRPGREALDAFVANATPPLAAQGRSLCLRPHLRHVLSDAQGCLRFLTDHAGMSVQIALSPAELISSEMMRDLPEHLERIFTALAARAALVLLHDIGGFDHNDLPLFVPLGQGILPADVLRGLIREHVPAETPIALQPQQLPAQLAWLQG